MNKKDRQWMTAEYNVKPNRNTSKTLYVLVIANILCEVLNEIGVFKVNVDFMRLGTLVSLALLVAPIMMVLNEEYIQKSSTKYVIMFSVVGATFLTCIMFNFHSTLILLLPLMVAMQYPSAKMFMIGFTGSVISALLGPILAFRFGVWDYQFITFLHSLFDASVAYLNPSVTYIAENLRFVFMYLSLPHLIFILGFSIIAYNVNQNTIAHVENKFEMLHISETDALTRLGNRTSYERQFPKMCEDCLRSISCIYIDANGLHELNNTMGHKEGDRFLLAVADGMRNTLESDDLFRIGGDEFVAFIKDKEDEEVVQLVDALKRQVENELYSIAVGYFCTSDLMCDMGTLISRAEAQMYKDKQKHHQRFRKTELV